MEVSHEQAMEAVSSAEYYIENCTNVCMIWKQGEQGQDFFKKIIILKCLKKGKDFFRLPLTLLCSKSWHKMEESWERAGNPPYLTLCFSTGQKS